MAHHRLAKVRPMEVEGPIRRGLHTPKTSTPRAYSNYLEYYSLPLAPKARRPCSRRRPRGHGRGSKGWSAAAGALRRISAKKPRVGTRRSRNARRTAWVGMGGTGGDRQAAGRELWSCLRLHPYASRLHPGCIRTHPGCSPTRRAGTARGAPTRTWQGCWCCPRSDRGARWHTAGAPRAAQWRAARRTRRPARRRRRRRTPRRQAPGRVGAY